MAKVLKIQLSIAPSAADPIYRQIMDQIGRRIAGGQLNPGDELPSVREVAEALTINPMTVSKAYAQLEASGVLERRRGMGMVVAATHDKLRTADARADKLRPTLQRAADEARQLNLDDETALELFKAILGGRS
jgi:GntR family transcriptional regulator